MSPGAMAQELVWGGVESDTVTWPGRDREHISEGSGQLLKACGSDYQAASRIHLIVAATSLKEAS